MQVTHSRLLESDLTVLEKYRSLLIDKYNSSGRTKKAQQVQHMTLEALVSHALFAAYLKEENESEVESLCQTHISAHSE